MDNEELVKNIATLQADVGYLRNQDAILVKMIEDVSKKVDGLKMCLMAAMAAAIVSLLTHALK